MIRVLLCSLAALCLGAEALAENWQRGLSSPAPGPIPAAKPLRTFYEFGWSAFTAGEGDFLFSRPKPGALRLDVTMKSTGMVRSLWQLDAAHTALARTNLRPISLEQKEVYKKETETTTVTFDPAGATRIRVATPADGKTKPKRFKIPHLFDLHTALLWVRSQNLDKGEKYRLAVLPATTAYLADITVLGRESIKTAGGRFDAIKLDLKLHRILDNRKLGPHKKFKRLRAWLSDDPERLLLRAEAELSIGSVWAELQKVERQE